MAYEWELKERELLARETAYLLRYNWFERIVDNHLYYCIGMVVVGFLAFDLGFVIGLLIH